MKLFKNIIPENLRNDDYIADCVLMIRAHALGCVIIVLVISILKGEVNAGTIASTVYFIAITAYNIAAVIAIIRRIL